MATISLLAPSYVYRDAVEFMKRDVCSFFMKKLSTHHLPTFQHSVRVALYSLSLAEAFGLAGRERDAFFRSVLLHDIGKLDVDAAVLNKRGALDAGEWAAIREHCHGGVELLRSLIEEGYVLSQIILFHHENLDGSGYPYAKTDKELDLYVRIVRIVDSYDAMVGHRGYNVPKSSEAALEELYRWSGVCYDENVVQAFHRFVAFGNGVDR
ncbi:HD-GYP domain-containing protein [Paenibacillus sp.]|uniref:HD-GYP domain-containing protein n=1 Tax=Paenibacillus sp. TaxID=58172 RepID=UPI002D6EEBF8|nr:HD domain-containing phosphohydrolase [Paenibacillus sp.]HZG88342.1 HD domain-containing phosphohydrolase [Paenibacillus sp.]